jgi:hypothetical protein
MQNESNTKENETASRDTMAAHLSWTLAALVIALTLFAGGYYLAAATIASMMVE